jgi:hypothetical protein
MKIAENRATADVLMAFPPALVGPTTYQESHIPVGRSFFNMLKRMD